MCGSIKQDLFFRNVRSPKQRRYIFFIFLYKKQIYKKHDTETEIWIHQLLTRKIPSKLKNKFINWQESWFKYLEVKKYGSRLKTKSVFLTKL